jgi:archaellum biogenesis protein FlaJ (TadC family)
MKLLDNYYLAVLRLFDFMYGKDIIFYRATGVVSFTIDFNFLSIVILIAPRIFKQYLWEFMFIVFIFGIASYYILDRIYNKKRRESLREQYKDESEEDRQRRATWVILYVIFSVVFLIFAVWISWRINSKI